MTILQRRVRTAVRYARAAAELLPPPPPRHDMPTAEQFFPEWERLVLQTAEDIATAVRHDRDALRLSIGPTIEVGATPPWRVLLELALTAAGGDTQHGIARAVARPGRITASARGRKFSPARTSGSHRRRR